MILREPIGELVRTHERLPCSGYFTPRPGSELELSNPSQGKSVHSPQAGTALFTGPRRIPSMM